jgi:hypothetical protein
MTLDAAGSTAPEVGAPAPDSSTGLAVSRFDIRFALVAAGALGLAGCVTTAAPHVSASCDRGCMQATVDGYLDALIAHDPSRLKTTGDVKFAENLQVLKLGEGSWATVDGRGPYSHYFADPASGNAGFIGTMRENGVPVIYDLRLKIVDGKIAEAESQIIRDPFGALKYEKALGQGPAPEWLEAVPPEKRLPRAELIAATDRYFTTMERNDGSGDYSFFADKCDRLEHATKTTNMNPPEPYGHVQDPKFTGQTCAEQWGTGFLGFVTEIRDRRELIVDEERQAVLNFITLDHNGTIRTLKLTGLEKGAIATLPPYFGVPRSLQVGEGFLVRDGKVFRIEMTLFEPPYGSQQPWSSSDVANSRSKSPQ